MKVLLNKSVIDKLEPKTSDYFVWDANVSNFGMRVYSSGRKTYLIQYRKGGGTRRYTIGAHGHLTVQQARKEAQVKLGEVATGGDPSQDRQREHRRLSLSQICDEYFEYGCEHKKASTIEADRYRLERHIRPILGKLKADDISQADITKFMKKVAAGYTPKATTTKSRGRTVFSGGKGTANRTVGLLGGIFSFAILQGYCVANPVHGVKKYQEGKRERFLSEQEYKRLGNAMTLLEKNGGNLLALKAIRLLAITGCRAGEVTILKWEFIDWENGYLRLPDTKTGYRNIPILGEGLGMLRELESQTKSEVWVFPNTVGGPLKDLRKIWVQLTESAKLPGVRIHDLRHSYASSAISAGISLYEIGKILGHRCQETTARYAHLSDEAVSRATSVTSEHIAAAMM